MTNEERDYIAPLIRSVFEELNKPFTEEDVERAIEKIDALSRETKLFNYSYKHPDYRSMVKEVPKQLIWLLDDMVEIDDVMDFEDILDKSVKMDRDTQVNTVNSLIYFWLDKWHAANPEEVSVDDSVWCYPIYVAIVIAERFALNECIPALLEIERQDRIFAETFFDQCDMIGMPTACIYQIATTDDLPQLAGFVRERGIYPFAKAEVIDAVATLPRRKPEWLPVVQQWLCELLAIFETGIDPELGDEMLLETIIHCCVHTRCEAAKPMIIRMYSKYKMPNILIPGGVNEVRKTIKRAEIGVLAEDRISAETIFQNSDPYDEYHDNDEDFDDEDDNDDYDAYDEDYDDIEEGEYDEEELEPRQRYCGWAMGGKAKYLPVKELKKYTLRVELERSHPLIWRELEVPSSLSLPSLAKAILLAMGWDEDHLHQFIGKGKKYYSTSVNEPDSPFHQTNDGSRYTIGHLLKKKGDSTEFEYDYGDSWLHHVKLKAMTDYADGEKPSVRLLGGANACPPDDSGGIYRYNNLLELMRERPKSRELYEFYEWMGCKWDLAFFPFEEAKKAVENMND